MLEIMLSSCPDIFGAGELTTLVHDGFAENKDCSCGRPCRKCDVWKQVIACLNLDEQSLREWTALQRKIDWHDGFFRQLMGVVSRGDQKRYKELNGKLLNAIGDITGLPILLDSSKYAGRALALFRILKADVMVICLTRSPAGLMTSFQKQNKDEQKPKSAIAAMLYYLITLTSVRIASVLLGKRMYAIRYESLLSDPENTLSEIEAWSGIDLAYVRRKLTAGETFPVGHLVTGNRLRKEKEIYFEPRMDNRSPVGLGAKSAVLCMNAWRWLLGF